MDGRNEFRVGLFPSGPCVTDESIEAPGYENETSQQLFEAIDAGNADERMLVLAKRACATCIQFENGHCINQAESLATELWRRGAGLQFVGGKMVSAKSTERPLSDEQPAFTWDLAVMPQEPAAALDILRQGLRAGQFSVRGFALDVQRSQKQYLERLAGYDPELHQKIVDLSPQERDQTFKHILMPLFQQKDFAQYSQNTSGTAADRSRYSPKNFDPDKDDAIITLYLKEAVAISELGLSQSGKKASYFSSDFYAALLQRKPDDLGIKTFDKLIANAPLKPVATLEAYIQSRDRAAQTNTTAPRTYVKAAGIANHTGNYVATVTELCEAFPDLSEKLIKRVCIKNVRNPHKALSEVIKRLDAEKETYGEAGSGVPETEQIELVTRFGTSKTYLEAIEKYNKNVAKLTELYGKDHAFTPSDIRSYSLRHLDDAVAAASSYKRRLTELESHSDGSVSQNTLKKAARSGLTSFSEIRKNYTQTLIRDRYAARAKREGLKKLDPEIIERIISLFPQSQTDQAAESVYALTNAGSLLKTTVDPIALGGQAHEDLDKIFSPKSLEYITFPAQLRELSPTQRLGFALYHGLAPLLYGRDIHQLQFEQAVLSHASLASYYDTDIAPLVAKLCGEGQTGTEPLSIMELSTDIAIFEKLLSPGTDHPLLQDAERLKLAGLRDATLVVGGKALYLHDKGYDWSWSDTVPDFRSWLGQKISSSYPPHQQKQARIYIEDAITAGAVELIGENPGEFRLVFSRSFYEDHVTEIDRAAVANAMGIDRILYGSDLTNAVRYRLGSTQQTVRISRTESPNVVAFTDDDLAGAEKELAYEAMGFAQLPPLQQILITVFGTDVRLDNVTDRQWQRIGDDLLNAYSRHIENPNHQHEVQDDHTRAQVALAWTYARGGDVGAQARLFSTASEELSEHINDGLAFILEQFAQIPTTRLGTTAKILGISSRPEATSKPDQIAALSEVAVKKVVTVSISSEPLQLTELKIAPSQNSELPEPELVERSVKRPTESSASRSLVKNYLLTIKNYPKLTAEQENQCAQEIQAGLAAQAALDEGNLSEQKISELQALVTSGATAKTRLIEANLRTVPYLVHILPPTYSMSDMDFIQAGNIGLIQAAERYLPGDVRFKTYASHYIAKYMRLAHRENFLPVTSEPSIAEKAYYYRGFATHMLDHEGRLPTDEEAMKNLKCSPKVLAKIKIAAQSSASYADVFEISEVHKMSGPATVINQQSKSSLDKQQETAHAALNYMVRSVLTDAGLVREAAALILANGLYLDPEVVPPGAATGRTYSDEEGAEILGVSRATFNRARNRALSVMSQPQTKRQLNYLLEEVDSPY